MAEVFEVEDLHTGRICALKRLLPRKDAGSRRDVVQRFEREFLQLAQLAHPRMVQVYDYFVSDEGPYYTLELLDGADLQQLAPLPWRRTCAIARDICSALSLLHSRGIVHRDLTPTNVRLASDGRAKLIDFGALTAFGSTEVVVGTPACSAPETVAKQALDARADLYALGATLYFTLTGRHGYPARHFSELAELWRRPLPEPSRLVPDIPDVLDTLVLSLLRLDPDARPMSAAEVMQRLHAIDGSPIDESLLVPQAYLSTPTLVGRTAEVVCVRAALERALSARGSALTIEGRSGVGRSRLLDACILEATLCGATVVRIAADDAQAGDWGVVRSIAAELLKLRPEVALQSARPLLGVLGHALPELRERAPEIELPALAAEQLRPQLQHALRAWLLALCAELPLVIAVDDYQRIDEPSATLLALLALELSDRALLLLATIEQGAPSVSDMACKLLQGASTRRVLQDLDQTQTALLLRSLFGDAPHLALLGDWLWRLTGGNPRQLMRVAQQLVDRELVRYHAGAWSLPRTLSETDLPLDATHAQLVCVQALSPRSRQLARALALCPGLEFSSAECARLCELSGDAPEIAGALDELRRTQIVRAARDGFVLANVTWEALLCAALDRETTAALHGRLAEVLALRPDQEFRVGKHLLLAGEIDRGLDVLIAHAFKSQEDTAHDEQLFLEYVHALPPDWLRFFRTAVQLCTELGRPRSQRFALLSRLAGLLARLGIDDEAMLGDLLRELKEDSGLADWAALDDCLDPMQRVQLALTRAQARYEAAPPQTRGLEPQAALKQLGRAMIATLGVTALSMSPRATRALPSLTPFAPLSPALRTIDLLSEGMCARYSGRLEQACAAYREILLRTAQSDRGGLDTTYAKYMRLGVMSTLGMIEAVLGRRIALDYASELECEVSHRVNALLIRTLYELWQGNGLAAEQSKRSVDRVRIENSATHWFEGSHLVWELYAYAMCEDLTRISHVREEMGSLCQRYPAWKAIDHYAAAQQHHCSGSYERALVEIQRALTLTAAGDHQSWPLMAALHLQVLLALDRAPVAQPLAHAYLEQATQAQHGYLCEYIRMALALVHASLAERSAAISCADAALACFRRAGITGLNLGLAWETRARVSLTLGDDRAFGEQIEICYTHYHTYKNPALTAKFDRLLREGKRARRA